MSRARHRAHNLSITIPENECAAALASAHTATAPHTYAGHASERAALASVFDPINVAPGVYLSGELSARDLEQFDVIINVAREVPCPLDAVQSPIRHGELDRHGIVCTLHRAGGRTIEYYSTLWDHAPQLAETLGPLTALMSAAVGAGKRVLVHCKCGISRSVTLVLAYVMVALEMSYSTAYAYVKERHPAISPNLSLVAQLLEWQGQLGQ